MDISKIASYKSQIYDNEVIEKKAIWSSLVRSLISSGPKVRNLASGAYNALAKGGVARKAVTGAGIGAASGALSNNPDNNDGSFLKSRFGSMAKGALGGAAVGAAAGVLSKGLKPIKATPTPASPINPNMANVNSGAINNTASEWIDSAFEKVAVLVPGTPQWIKQKDDKDHPGRTKKKKKLEKKAFIGGEDGAGKTIGTKSKDDPYRTTKTVGGVEIANHGLNLATDIGAAGLASAGGLKALKGAIKGKGLKEGFKSVVTNPEFRKDLSTTLKSQKYILPVGAAISAGYMGKAYLDDKRHKIMRKEGGLEYAQEQHDKLASDESPRECAVETWGKKSILEDNRPDSKYDPKELAIGLRIEHEHTRKVLPYDQATFIAAKIAKDHLDEFPDYYTRLERLEEQAKKAKDKKVKK
jgi:hypothetical protein